MHIRLHGKPADIETVLKAIGQTLDIADVSRVYHDRHPSQLVRCYLTATVKCTGKEIA